jgi:two-component sensor histidine kinase
LELVWIERGGPPVKDQPSPAGFGSKLVHRTIAMQLGGTIDYEWLSDGLVVTLKLERARLLS